MRALEVGGGAGGGFRHWMGLLDDRQQVQFIATDGDEGLLRAYRDEARSWACESGFRINDAQDELRFDRSDRTISLHLHEARAPDDFAQEPPQSFDLLLGQSFWDLVPAGTALPLARRLLGPGGVFHSTLTFAGATRFEPAHPLDPQILAAYHASMARDGRGGDPQAGERLIADFAAPDSGFAVLNSGRSDWRVAPREGRYPSDEAFFLETILRFFKKELNANPNVTTAERTAWLDARRRELREGRLVYTARQFDLVARRDG